MILAMPSHGWDILPITRMEHSILVMDRTVTRMGWDVLSVTGIECSILFTGRMSQP